MPDHQGNIGVLGDAEHDHQQHTQGETGHDVRVDHRNLVYRGDSGAGLLSGIEGADCAQRAENRGDQG